MSKEYQNGLINASLFFIGNQDNFLTNAEVEWVNVSRWGLEAEGVAILVAIIAENENGIGINQTSHVVIKHDFQWLSIFLNVFVDFNIGIAPAEPITVSATWLFNKASPANPMVVKRLVVILKIGFFATPCSFMGNEPHSLATTLMNGFFGLKHHFGECFFSVHALSQRVRVYQVCSSQRFLHEPYFHFCLADGMLYCITKAVFLSVCKCVGGFQFLPCEPTIAITHTTQHLKA